MISDFLLLTACGAFALAAFAMLSGCFTPWGDFYCGIKVTKSPFRTYGSKTSLSGGHQKYCAVFWDNSRGGNLGSCPSTAP